MFDINIKFYALLLLGPPQFWIFSKIMWITEFLYLLSLGGSEESFYPARVFLTAFSFGKRCNQHTVKVLLRVNFCLPSHVSSCEINCISLRNPQTF